MQRIEGEVTKKLREGEWSHLQGGYFVKDKRSFTIIASSIVS